MAAKIVKLGDCEFLLVDGMAAIAVNRIDVFRLEKPDEVEIAVDFVDGSETLTCRGDDNDAVRQLLRSSNRG